MGYLQGKSRRRAGDAAEVQAPQFVFGLFSPTLEHLWGKVNSLGKPGVFLIAVTSLV